MTELSAKIEQALATRGWAGLSTRALAAKTGDRLSKDTIAIYRRGDHGVPDENTLQAWAELLDVPISDLRAVAGVPTGDLGEYVPPAIASRMSRRQRDAVTELITAMVTKTPST